MKKRYKGRRRKELDIAATVFGALFVMVVATWLVVGKFNYDRRHFEEGTTINGVDCSMKTVEDAKKEIENQPIALVFPETFSQANGKDMGRTIREENEIESFLYDQRVEKSGTKEYELKSTDYEVNEEMLRTFLNRKEEFHNTVLPQDAYAQWDSEGRFIEIVPEVYGRGINLEDACSFARETLLSGETMIDFSSITAKEPEIKASDLYESVQFINEILQLEISFQFKDGSTYTLDCDTTKEWIYYDETTRTYQLDEKKMEEGINEVVEFLSKKVRQLGTTMEYMTPEGEIILLPVQWGSYDTLNEEAEKEAIRSMLSTRKTYNNVELIYSKCNDMKKFESYITVSIIEQRLRVFENGKEIYNFPIITGTANVNDTPRGVFYSNWQTTHYYLSKANVWVEFWITVNGNVGIHDADNWRNENEYTADRYLWDGSHGCINMKRVDVVVIYDYIKTTMPIIIY